MPPAIFPIAKFGVLLVNQFSRMFVSGARRSAVFQDWVVVPLGQKFHNFEVSLKMGKILPKLDKKMLRKVPELSQNDAIEQGSAILSEILIIVIASGLIAYEYRKHIKHGKEVEKEKEEEKDWLDNKLKREEEGRAWLNNKIVELEIKVDRFAEIYLQRQYEHMIPADKIAESDAETSKDHPDMIDNFEDAPSSPSEQITEPTKVEKEPKVCTYKDEREP